MMRCLYCLRPHGCLADLCDRCAIILLTAEHVKQLEEPTRQPVRLQSFDDLVANTRWPS